MPRIALYRSSSRLCLLPACALIARHCSGRDHCLVSLCRVARHSPSSRPNRCIHCNYRAPFFALVAYRGALSPVNAGKCFAQKRAKARKLLQNDCKKARKDCNKPLHDCNGGAMVASSRSFAPWDLFEKVPQIFWPKFVRSSAMAHKAREATQ